MAEGQSRFTLRADNAQYDSAMRKSEKATRDAEKSQEDLGKTANESAAGVGRLSAAISSGRERLNNYSKVALAAGVALTTGLVKAGLSSGDALAKTSDQLGVTTEKLAGLRHAAELTGAGSSTLDMGLEKLSIRMAEAAAGTGSAVKSFQALGIQAGELVKLSPDEAMYRVADSLKNVENSAQKTKIAYDIFGRSGTALVNTVAGGSAALREYQAEAEAAGVALSRIDARKIEIANDSIFRVKQQMTGFSQQLAVQFAPVLEGVADRLFGIGKESGGMATAAEKAFNYMVKGVGIMANGVRGLEIGWNLMKLAFQESANFIVSWLDKLSRAAIDMYNSLPWTDEVQYTTMFSGFLLNMESAIAESKRRIDDLVNAPLPSDAIEAFVDESKRAFEAQAIEVQESQIQVQDALITTDDVTEALATNTKALAVTTKESTKEMTSAWDDALTGMVERIDTGFSSAWRAALDGDGEYFKNDFLGDMLEAVKEFAAELLHLNITRPIVSQVGAAFGLGTGVATAASGVTGAGLLSGGAGAASSLSSLYSGVTGLYAGGFSGLYQGASTYLSGLATSLGPDSLLGGLAQNASLNSAYTSGVYSGGTALQNLGYGAANIGAGLVGSYAGQAIFGGNTTGVGAGVGGAVGSIWGPIGAGVGSFIGEGLETGLGNLLGFGGGGNNSAIANITGGVSSAAGVGNNFSEKNLAAASQLGDAIAQFAALLGNDSYSARIRVGNRSGLKLDGAKYSDADELLSAAFDQIIRGANGIDDAIRPIIQSFEGSADERLAFTQSVLSINDLVSVNPVGLAMEGFVSAQESASRTLLDVYQEQVNGVLDLANNFDGSLDGIQSLSAALLQNGDFAYSLAQSYQNVSQQLGDVLGDSAQKIRDSVLTDAERLQAAREERNQLRSEIGYMLDPGELQSSGLRIEALTNQIFGALSGEEQRARSEDFAKYLEELAAVIERQSERGRQDAERSQDQLAGVIEEALDRPSDSLDGAAQRMDNLTASVQQLISQLASSGVRFAENVV